LIHCALAVLYLLEIRDCLVLISDNALSAQPFVERQIIQGKQQKRGNGAPRKVAFRRIFAYAKFMSGVRQIPRVLHSSYDISESSKCTRRPLVQFEALMSLLLMQTLRLVLSNSRFLIAGLHA
jgi:hypothetical protein